jgi:hypothetical protein
MLKGILFNVIKYNNNKYEVPHNTKKKEEISTNNYLKGY